MHILGGLILHLLLGTYDSPLPPPSHAPAPSVPRIIYPYSVVPGGVDEMPGMHPVRLDKPLHAYVSYRVNGLIRVTKHRITIPARELLFTDDQEAYIRARCGNTVYTDASKIPPPEMEPHDSVVELEFPTVPQTAPDSPTLLIPPGSPATAPPLDSQWLPQEAEPIPTSPVGPWASVEGEYRPNPWMPDLPSGPGPIIPHPSARPPVGPPVLPPVLPPTPPPEPVPEPSELVAALASILWITRVLQQSRC